MIEIDMFSKWQVGVCIAFRLLQKCQTSPQETAVESGPRSAPGLWCEPINCIIYFILYFSSFLVLTQWWWTCAACDATASGPEPVLRKWQRLEEAAGTTHADCMSSPIGNSAEERAKILSPDRVRKSQTSYCLHPMLKCLCAFSLQHLTEIIYISIGW